MTMISRKQFERYAANPSAFRDDLQIDADGHIRKFGDVMDAWQRKDFQRLDSGIQRAIGRKAQLKPINRAYLERGRGHSKTLDLGVLAARALAFATRPIKGYAFAADRDQAALLRDAVETTVRLNPWLGSILEVQKTQITNIANGHPGEGARLEIFTSDVGSSYGILPDLIICDELTHWAGDGSLWHSIISSAAKRSTCFLCVISNAGFLDSWQWQVREAARTSADWYFSQLDGPQASWLTQDRLEEQRRMLPNNAYARLWLNQWSTGGGDALTPDDIEAAFAGEYSPMDGRDKNFLYVGGLDLGLVRDCAAFVILAVPQGGTAGKIRLAHHRLWRPDRNTKVDLLDVERHLLNCDEAYGLEHIAFDPWQAEHLAQTLEADTTRRRRNGRAAASLNPWMREIAPTGTNLRQQASLTIESFQDRRLQLYDCEPLRRDLLKLRVEEKSYGFRLVSPRDEHGHGDTASAFCLGLLIAHELAGEKPLVVEPMFDESINIGRDHWADFEHRREMYELEKKALADYEEHDPDGFLQAAGRGQLLDANTGKPFQAPPFQPSL